jgi:nucleotide-binding universal stress UspA family protein
VSADPGPPTAGLVIGYQAQAGPDLVAFARRWSRAAGEPVTFVSVYPGHAPLGAGRVDAEWVAYNREEAERILGEAEKQVGDAVPAHFHALAADSAAHGLHDLVEGLADDPAVVVLGSRKSRGSRRTNPGSTAERLLQGSPTAVALVPWGYEAAGDHDLARVSVAYVDTADGRVALRAACTIAERLHATLEVVSVVPDTRVVPSLGDVRRFGEEQRASFQASLDAAVAGLPAAVRATGRLLDGPTVDALADLTPDETDLLVCGSRGYGPARRVLLGGVSSRVLRHARVPVVVVPRG